MKSAILSVGTELLFGQITNTNSVYLSQKLNLLGIDVMYHETVGDNPERVKKAIHQLFSEVDLIITTGGLGPTQDDLTKEMAAEVMDAELVLDEPSLEYIKKIYAKMNRKMADNNIKQAYLPKEGDGIIFPNPGGTAPGCGFEKDGKIIICLPGPPREMKKMFDSAVYPFLKAKSSYIIYSKMLRIFGLGESQLEDMLSDFITGQTDPTMATYAKEGEVCLRITSKRENQEEAERAVMGMVSLVEKRVGDHIFSYDDEDLVDVVAKKLVEKDISISCAESCTGGMFASTMMGYPGISAVFERGIVSYSNRAKMEELGVKQETLDTFGAVSCETAAEMTKGLKEKTGSRLCISITGIVGPGGSIQDKSVGLVYICIDFDGKLVCNEYRMRDVNRNWNRNYSVLLMLNMINRLIDGNWK